MAGLRGYMTARLRLSIAVCTHNEAYYVRSLLRSLVDAKKRAIGTPFEYEIVVVDDFSTDSITLDAFEEQKEHIVLRRHALANDFATHKNAMNSYCTGDWILNLDADETISDDLLDSIPMIIEANPEVEAYWLPRVNTVEGLTLAHVQKWGWVITTLPGFRKVGRLGQTDAEYELLKAYGLVINEDDGWVTYDAPIICWPDKQMRLYKNTPTIKWEGKVHERLTGFDNYSMFPMTPEFAIQHHKEIRRQEQQNNYYDTLQR